METRGLPLTSEGDAIEAFRKRPRIVRLRCGIQHYDWGDPDAIPAMMGIANPTRRPFAELWIGAHPDLPSQALIDGVLVPLTVLTDSAPVQTLGQAVGEHFGGHLPFLFKILAAHAPLSIQAHPNEDQARTGFARENRAAIPRDAAQRSYRDPRHKPELLVAITDFYGLRGFRPLEAIAGTLARTPELVSLHTEFEVSGQNLPALYGRIMRMDRGRLNALLFPLIRRLRREDEHQAFQRTDWAHWLLVADRAYSSPGRPDRGLLSMPLLNLVHLRPGQAMYLPSGELHSYLQGVGIEIMANSNNVLRGGLTRKHVDVEGLLKTLTFQAAPAHLLQAQRSPDDPRRSSYRTPSEEFILERLVLPAGRELALQDQGPTLVLPTRGSVLARQEGFPSEPLRAGEALLAPAGLDWRLAPETDALVWLARVPSATKHRRSG